MERIIKRNAARYHSSGSELESFAEEEEGF
ncbi:MAG: hypothetical protein ACI9S8_002549 [Chlamydiales bacterium]|jgi:hypothetical protein